MRPREVRLGEDRRTHLALLETVEDIAPIYYRHVARTLCGWTNLSSHGPINRPKSGDPWCKTCRKRAA